MKGFSGCSYIALALALSLSIALPASADSTKVIGAMKPVEAIKKLEELGKPGQYKVLKNKAMTFGDEFDFSTFPTYENKVQPWQHTNHVIGFIATSVSGGSQARDLIDATNIAPANDLKDQFIKITLDRLRVFSYPGGGIHNILFDFYGQHQAAGTTEDIHFNQIYRAQEGESAGVIGYPVFIGLKLAKEGLRMRVRTVNVSNQDDEKLLSFMSGDTFKNGLQLINTTNPLTPVVTKFATGLFESIATRNRNVAVQDIDMGMDFSNVSTRPKISQGSYIAIQTPVQNWDWSKWKFYPSSGQILSNDGKQTPIPFNYIVFSISKTL